MLKSFNETTKNLSYVHSYGQSELDFFKNEVSRLGLAIADTSVQLTLGQTPGVGGVLKITNHNYQPKSAITGKRGSYVKHNKHDRAYLLAKRRQVKRDFELFSAESNDRVMAGVLHFNGLNQLPQKPHVALKRVKAWLSSSDNKYIDNTKFCSWAEYGDTGMHVHFLACLKAGMRFETNSHHSQLVKAIQSSWSYGYAEITPQPYQLERLANYWVTLPDKGDTTPYGPVREAQLVSLRDSLAHEINQWQRLPQTPQNKGKIADLMDRKKAVQKQIKQGRAKNYPNSKLDNPYYSNLSGFKTTKLNVTTEQAKVLARLGYFIHGKLSAKALSSVDKTTGEISNGPVLATVSLFLKLSPEEVKQVLRLKPGFELNKASNHKS
jgi:hypothetical protein